jgi:hypothetical protein
MKTRLKFRNAIALALALGLWAPPGASAQTNGQSQPVRQRLAGVIVRNPEGVTNPAVFYFPGGTPRDFMKAVEKCYQVDWLSIAHIPEEMQSVQLPTLRVPRYAWPPPSGYPARQNELAALVSLYNSLSEREPQFGTLVVMGDPTEPSVVRLVPNNAGGLQVRVKAFSIQRIPEQDWEKLDQDILRARSEAVEFASTIRKGSATARLLEGTVNIHPNTKLLIAVGSDPYVEMVESIVAAHQANQHPVIENLVTPTNK